MKDLRERCEKLLIKADKYNPEPFTYEDIEAFAREIRNEALEEAAKAVESHYYLDGKEIAPRILALKTDALAASEDEK